MRVLKKFDALFVRGLERFKKSIGLGLNKNILTTQDKNATLYLLKVNGEIK